MRRWLKRIAIATATVLVFGVGAMMCSRVAQRGRFATASSTYSAGPTGARALYDWATREGLRPQRLVQDFGRLPATGLLVALATDEESEARRPTQAEHALLMRFVERGGVVLVAGANRYLPIDAPVGIGPEPHAGSSDSNANDHDDDTPASTSLVEDESEPPPQSMRVVTELLSGIPGLAMRGSEIVRYDESREVTVLLERDGQVDANGQPTASSGIGATAVVCRHGRGAILAFASPSLFQNRDLIPAGGAVAFSRIVAAYAPHGPVLFDEYHLGIGERRSIVKYLADFGAGAVFLQLLIIAAFAIVRSSSSLGPPMPKDIPPAGGTASYVNAIGTLYRNSKDVAAAGRILLQDAYRRIARFHSVAMSGSASQLVSDLEAAQQHAAAAAARALVGLENSTVHKPANFVAHVDAAVQASTTALTLAKKE